MLFVIDIGNTNTVLGVYQNDQLTHSWRVKTERQTTEDEFHIQVSNLFMFAKIALGDIEHTVASCVVPPMIGILDAFCIKYLNHSPFWVNAKNVSIPICLKNPDEVGADRLVNAIAAINKYDGNLIVIDFGTATTFDCISSKGEYLGGAISPGIMIASEALFMNASKLPRVDIYQPPKNIIGKDTAESIQSGIIFGYAGLVDGIVKRISLEMDSPTIIATGGLAPLMANVSQCIEQVEPDLTLEGLRLIAQNK
ncbi:MAG: type III pantothenate kinase [Candidatus Magnetoglobus multicellularis str. Araruama]|uniref:Type III pantothenate kinase n=1 Tax=Candidatus Magnetoglobus multicellularis str. Araruama TaxID=890399 RepID=A0A1V1PI42_9BACT|nr:MAG: type III pantothenate kinase [Candidatus Magnetoglobus multicellularis str. Araruama]